VKKKIALALFMVLLVASFALAAAVQENYAEIRKSATRGVPTFLAAFSALDGSDSTTWSATALTGRSHPTDGDPILEVSCRFTARGATAMIVCGRRDSAGGFHSISAIQTATALDGSQTVYDSTGYYSEPLYFALNGWKTYELRVYDVSGSNTVDLKPVTVGASGSAAQ